VSHTVQERVTDTAVEQTFEPRIVGILCNWCSYAGADKAGAAQLEYPANLRTVRVMCSGRVDPAFVLEAFEAGADGVLVLACHPGDCHYKEQNHRALARHRLLSRLLRARGVDPRRTRFGFVSAAEAQEFVDIVTEMTETLRTLGPARVQPAVPTPRRPPHQRVTGTGHQEMEGTGETDG
jgi:F420-non-reducing hydrogenase iron-sulfur subunit